MQGDVQMVESIFRPFDRSGSLGSDRTARDRKRHLGKVKKAIQEGIADIIAEESIIGRDRDKVIKIPVRGVKEYRFVYGDNQCGVGSGQGDTQPGQVVGERQDGQGEPGKAGDQPGVDYYETGVTIDEFLKMVFQDLKLPDLAQKILRQVTVQTRPRPRGKVRKGNPARFNARATMKERIKDAVARAKMDELREWKEDDCEGPSPHVFTPDMRRYKRVKKTRPKQESNAVVMCIMDTSGSMDTMKKYLARSFFMLLYQFIKRQYERVELVFIAHHSQAKEVSEEEFFHKGESGGTMISSGYKLALEIIAERFHPDHWNIYAFHCSDGDNFENDTPDMRRTILELAKVCNRLGYAEIKPLGSHFYESSQLDTVSGIAAEHGLNNVVAALIEGKENVWEAFVRMLSEEAVNEALQEAA